MRSATIAAGTMGYRADYAAWHDSVPMRILLERLDPDDFFVEGRDVRIRDAKGRWYLDARAGLWNVSLGYSHPRVVSAVVEQLNRLPFSSFTRYGRPAEVAVEYANALAARLPASLRHIRFVSTGSAATETAVLLSRFVRSLEGQAERTVVIALRSSWHGTGPGASALTGEERLHRGYGPLLPDVVHVDAPFPGWEDRAAAALQEAVARDPDRVSAIIVEPVLGTGGIALPPEYVELLLELRSMYGLHLIADEVTTGLGRTGAFTRCEQIGLEPDLLALGKGMTSGYVPLACVACSDAIYGSSNDVPETDAFGIGSTSDGHPLAMAAGMAVLDALEEELILPHTERVGGELADVLEALREHEPSVLAVRGTGLMIGVVLGDDDDHPWPFERLEAVRYAAEERGVLISTVPGAIMLMPPLIVDDEHLAEIADALAGAVAIERSRSAPAAP